MALNLIQDIDSSKYITFIASSQRLLHFEKQTMQLQWIIMHLRSKGVFKFVTEKNFFKSQTIKTLKYNPENNTFIVREKLNLFVKGDNLAQVKLQYTACWESTTSLLPFQIICSINHMEEKIIVEQCKLPKFSKTFKWFD